MFFAYVGADEHGSEHTVAILVPCQLVIPTDFVLIGAAVRLSVRVRLLRLLRPLVLVGEESADLLLCCIILLCFRHLSDDRLLHVQEIVQALSLIVRLLFFLLLPGCLFLDH